VSERRARCAGLVAVVLIQAGGAAVAVGQTEEPKDVEDWVCCPCERLAAYTGNLAEAALGMQSVMDVIDGEATPEAQDELGEVQAVIMEEIVYRLSKGMGFAAARLAVCLEEENQPFYDAGLVAFEGAMEDLGAALLDSSADPNFGKIRLRAGFAPDPHASELIAGGIVDASYLGGSCIGYVSSAPDIRLEWEGHSDGLGIAFLAEEAGDATLVVNTPEGSWVCNDDADTTTNDPIVTLPEPSEGQYHIWVGTYEGKRRTPGELVISERLAGL